MAPAFWMVIRKHEVNLYDNSKWQDVIQIAILNKRTPL